MGTERPRAREIVVIGASAGGVEALKRVIGALARSEAAVFVVLHVSSIGTSVLPDILGRVSGLRVEHAQEGDDIERGRVYVAPPDRHLLLEVGPGAGRGRPEQNGHRPASIRSSAPRRARTASSGRRRPLRHARRRLDGSARDQACRRDLDRPGSS